MTNVAPTKRQAEAFLNIARRVELVRAHWKYTSQLRFFKAHRIQREIKDLEREFDELMRKDVAT